MRERKVRLVLYITPGRAARIVGSLWASGELSRAQYNHNMRKIDAKKLEMEEAKNKKFEKYMARIRQFYNKGVPITEIKRGRKQC